MFFRNFFIICVSKIYKVMGERKENIGKRERRCRGKGRETKEILRGKRRVGSGLIRELFGKSGEKGEYFGRKVWIF